MKNGRKSFNLVKIHELMCHFIRGYLVLYCLIEYLNTKNCFEIALPTFRYVSVFYLPSKHANYIGKRPQKLHLETKDYEGVKVQNKI